MDSHGIAIIVISALIAVAWMPVGIHFWKAWKNRGSPLSLAICALIAYPIFTNASTAIFLNGSSMQTVLSLVFINAALLVNFAACFRWQKERFPEARSRPVRSDVPPDFWGIKKEYIKPEGSDPTIDPNDIPRKIS